MECENFMKYNTLKYISLFIWSPVFAPIYFYFSIYVQRYIPKSNIDSSTIIGNIIISPEQMSNIIMVSFFVVDAILQIILFIIYKKWGLFIGKYKALKASISIIFSYIIFLIVTVITLGISYSYTMSNFH